MRALRVEVIVFSFFLLVGCGTRQTEQDKPKQKSLGQTDQTSIEMGQQTYQYYCVACHGLYGRGNGPNAKNIAEKFHIAPANLAEQKVQEKSNDKLQAIIEKGGKHEGLSPYMPPWGMTLGREKVMAVVRYIRTLAKLTPPSIFVSGEPKTMEERITLGRRNFVENCAPCHRLDGKGKGPYWQQLKAKDPTFPEPPDFTDSVYMRTLTDEHIRHRILYGYREGEKKVMPPWWRKLSEEDILNAIAFVRTLSQVKR